MDIFLDTDPERLAEMLQSLDFEVKKKRKYYWSKLPQPGGRLHAMFSRLGDKTYLDFHFDKSLHLLFFHVDYVSKPQSYFDRILKSRLDAEQINYHIRKDNWWSRRDKSIFHGFRT